MKETSQFNWQTLVVIIGTILLVVLLIFYLFFSLVYPDYVKKVPNFLPAAGSVLGVNGGSSPKPTETPASQTNATQPPQTIIPTPEPSTSPQATSPPTNLVTESVVASPVTSSTPSPMLPMNDSFENGLGSWQKNGEVMLIDQPQNGDGFTKPYHGNKMIRIGSTKNEGWPLTANWIRIDLPAGYKKCSLHYAFFSNDYAGFDDPGFLVTNNQQSVFQLAAKDIDGDDKQTISEHLDSSGWKELTIPFSHSNESHTIRIYAGNDEFNLSNELPHQSWVYIDSVTAD